MFVDIYNTISSHPHYTQFVQFQCFRLGTATVQTAPRLAFTAHYGCSTFKRRQTSGPITAADVGASQYGSTCLVGLVSRCYQIRLQSCTGPSGDMWTGFLCSLLCQRNKTQNGFDRIINHQTSYLVILQWWCQLSCACCFNRKTSQMHWWLCLVYRHVKVVSHLLC